MIDQKNLLATIPEGLRTPLLDEYRGLCNAFNEGRWKLTALDAGRFCEVAYTIIEGMLTGNFAAAPKKPGNFVKSCQDLEQKPVVAVGDRSLRILIPRLLPALYEIRNNRNVGHVGGDVESNKMDATFVREAATWVVAELVRISHRVTTIQAQTAVDALVERTHPLVWEIDGIKRVLEPDMKMGDKALLLLYSTPGWTATAQLKQWIPHSENLARALRTLFEKHLLELRSEQATITPTGSKYVEDKILKPREAKR